MINENLTFLKALAEEQVRHYTQPPANRSTEVDSADSPVCQPRLIMLDMRNRFRVVDNKTFVRWKVPASGTTVVPTGKHGPWNFVEGRLISCMNHPIYNPQTDTSSIVLRVWHEYRLKSIAFHRLLAGFQLESGTFSHWVCFWFH